MSVFLIPETEIDQYADTTQANHSWIFATKLYKRISCSQSIIYSSLPFTTNRTGNIIY